MKTKISWILLGLGLSGSAAFAAHAEETPMPVSNDINMTAPAQSGAWSFGLMAVLMQPTNQNFTYATIVPDETENDSGGFAQENNFQDVKPGYHGWFNADVTYAFAGNGRDVTLAYEGLHGHDSAEARPNADSELYTIAYPYDYYDPTATGKTNTRYDAGDLVFGQKMDVGTRVQLHPFAGLRYAYIDVKNVATYTGGDDSDDPDSPPALQQDTWESTFSGIGPRLGSDAAVRLGCGFSMRARLGLSVLIGSSSPKYNEIYSSNTSSTDSYSYYPITHSSTTQVVPEIDGRLGVNYAYQMDTNTNLSFEAGWQATEYFNGVSMIGAPSDDPIADSAVTASNFGLQGPYARVQLDIS